jgi:hypothetical protein
MVGHRILVDSYLASARAAAPTQAGRLAWLEGRRADLSAEVEGGDWEVSSASFQGHASTSRRLSPAAARLKAVFEAIEILTADPEATRSRGQGILIPRFSGIPHA